VIVVDASVWVSHLLQQDVHHSASRQWLSGILQRGEAIAGPGLLLAEVAGAIARRTANPQLGHRAVAHVSSTPGLRILPSEPELAMLAARLAADLRLRGPDALYVAVAQRLNIPLATWDKEQLARADAVIASFTPDQGSQRP